MNRKISISILLLLVFSITSVGTYSFLFRKTTSSNVVATGNFPAKFNVKLYAATGPVFMDNTFGHVNNYSDNYMGWFDDASKYILKDLTGQVLGTTPANIYQTYNNIGSNAISRKRVIVAANFYSWEGEVVTKGINEDGTTMHHMVVLESSKRVGDSNSPKINLADLTLGDTTVSIDQYDTFIGKTTKGEYVTLKRPVDFFEPLDADNKSRARTYDYINGKYVQTFSGGSGAQPAAQADLIIFDAGGRGYYAPSGEASTSDRDALYNIYDRICGNKAFDSGTNTNIFTTEVMSSITSKENGFVTLDNSICEVKILKNGNVVDRKTNTIVFSENK